MTACFRLFVTARETVLIAYESEGKKTVKVLKIIALFYFGLYNDCSFFLCQTFYFLKRLVIFFVQAR